MLRKNYKPKIITLSRTKIKIMMNKSKRTMMKTVFLAVIIATGVFNVSYGQTKVEKLDKLISAYAEFGKFNGSVLVAEKGKVIYKKGFGLADMEWNIPNQSDTKHRLGSITKQFTSMLIMQLVEQGKLKLDVPISTYLPDYPKKNGDVITLHHLLTHSSGTPNMTNFPAFVKDIMRKSYSPVQLVNLFADSTLQFKPGERFDYSNSGYILLGYIIEKVSGKSYEQVLQENIFTPLKMSNTGYDHARPLLKNRARGYEKNGRVYVNADFIDMSVPYAAGSMYSTVEDLYLWDQALYGNQLLRKENMELLFTKHIASGGGHYGYGWGVGEVRLGNTEERKETVGHGGGINGFNTQITRILSNKSFIVLLNNTGGAPLNEMTDAIAAIIYDKSYDLPKRSVAYSLADRIEKVGIPAALEYYKGIKDSIGYYLNENEMNGTGYEFLQTGKVKEAAAIFKLNSEAFPKSSNVFDSYGEALMVLGNKTEALENYKKSVKLNPGNEGGIKILKDNGIKTDDLIKKVPLSYLKLLEGEYQNVDNKEWKIKFEITEGILYGNDRGYRYKVLPVGEGEFVNPDDGASLVFDTKDKNAIALLLFGTARFKKVM
ncbi:MAG: serine hydrolase [Chryseolinea sp.]